MVDAPILLKYLPGFEPRVIRARGGLLLTALTVILLLPMEAGAVVLSMAVASGQLPIWPTVGQGMWVLPLLAGIFGGAPLYGTFKHYGWPDTARWVLLDFTVAGAITASIATIVLLLVNAPHDARVSVPALAWLWAAPGAGLLVVRLFRFGHPLPRLQDWVHMLDRRTNESLPIAPRHLTGKLDVRAESDEAYVLWTPEATFWLPYQLGRILDKNANLGTVEYDLRHGRVLTIESPPGRQIYQRNGRSLTPET